MRRIFFHPSFEPLYAEDSREVRETHHFIERFPVGANLVLPGIPVASSVLVVFVHMPQLQISVHRPSHLDVKATGTSFGAPFHCLFTLRSGTIPECTRLFS